MPQTALGVACLDASQQFLDINPALEKLLGYTPSSLRGRSLDAITHPEDQRASRHLYDQLAAGSLPSYRQQKRYLHRDGSVVWVDLSVVKISNFPSSPISQIAFVHDITEHKRIEETLEKERRFFQEIIDSLTDAVMVIGADFRIITMNRRARDQANHQDQNLGANPFCYQLSHRQDFPCSGDDHPCPLRQVQRLKHGVTVIHQHRDPDGEQTVYEISAVPLWNEDGSFRALIETCRNITDRLAIESQLSEKEQHLYYLGHHDALTGLPNRILAMDRLQQAIAEARRKQELVAVLMVDLDRFKTINEALGHKMGDSLLRILAERLSACARDTDTIGRLGGDEFLVILPGLRHLEDVRKIADKLLKCLAKECDIGGLHLKVTASVGVSIYPTGGEDGSDLLRGADAAMYRAKARGGNGYEFSSVELNALTQRSLTMEIELRRALDRGELVLFYQPQIDLASGLLTGVEALMRWDHPEKGLIPPGEFIPQAEESGLIVPMGAWALRTAALQAKSWAPRWGRSLPIAVNISSRQFQDADFLATIDQILTETGVDAAQLELEITESLLMGNDVQTISVLSALRRRGFTIAIDDFGTGYSSLQYLKSFPIDRLKIDRSFVSGLTEEMTCQAIPSAIVAMCHGLSLQVIAEGVETANQATILGALGCRIGQGYLYAPPLPAAELQRRFLDHRGGEGSQHQTAG